MRFLLAQSGDPLLSSKPLLVLASYCFLSSTAIHKEDPYDVPALTFLEPVALMACLRPGPCLARMAHHWSTTGSILFSYPDRDHRFGLEMVGDEPGMSFVCRRWKVASRPSEGRYNDASEAVKIVRGR